MMKSRLPLFLAAAALVGAPWLAAVAAAGGSGAPAQSSAEDIRLVAEVTESVGSIPHWERIDAIQKLSANLGQPEIARLFGFLRATDIPQGLESEQVWALKNDLLNVLRAQSTPPREYQSVLLAILNNPSQDAVMRDYAVQHARPWYPFSEDKPGLLTVLWSVAEGSDGSLPGTAMLSLWGIWQESPADVDRDRLAARAFSIANNPKSHIDARISCLQICGQLGAREALPLAIKTARTGTPRELQMSAIATIGNLGDASHQALLAEIASRAQGRPGVQFSAKVAAEKIARRNR